VGYGKLKLLWLVVSNMLHFPFHIWEVILPIDELIYFKMVKTTNQFFLISLDGFLNYPSMISMDWLWYHMKLSLVMITPELMIFMISMDWLWYHMICVTQFGNDNSGTYDFYDFCGLVMIDDILWMWILIILWLILTIGTLTWPKC
jgi:hypothetical protein